MTRIVPAAGSRCSLSGAVLFALLATAGTAGADCRFDADNTIVNPFDDDCGGRIFTYTEADASGNDIPLGYPVPQPVDSLTPVDGFRSYAALRARHQELAATRATVTETIVGTTLAGLDILAYRLGDADAVTAEGFPEPAVLVNGGIHAREWQSPETLSAILEWLAEEADDDGIGSYLAGNLHTVLIPVLNVDGFLQTQRFPATVTATPAQPRDGRMRRKNLREADTGGVIDADLDTRGDNFWGVDLNRNSPEGHGLNQGSSSNPVSLVYRAAVPGSEPEIVALQQAASLAPPERLRLYIDVHSFTQIYLAPQTGNPRRDAITAALAERMRAVGGFKYRYRGDTPGSGGIGTTADFFAYRYDIPAWTLETEPLNGAQDYGGTASHGHSGFILPDAEVARMRRELTEALALGFYRQAGPPAAIAAEIRDAVSGELRYRAEWLREGGARRLAVDTNLALRPGNRYRLWLAWSKPMRWRDAAGAIAAYPGQTVDAGSGSARLEFRDGSGAVALEVADGGAWLGQPGGAPEGYLRYRDDALAVEFTLPADLAQGGALGAQLRLENRDLSGLALDADPATAADWAQGHWTGYESAVGNEGDTGGADCSFKPWVAADDSGSAPATSPGCFSATTGGGGTSSGGGGGGGGAPHPALLAAFACALFARRLPQRVLSASRRAPASSRES